MASGVFNSFLVHTCDVLRYETVIVDQEMRRSLAGTTVALPCRLVPARPETLPVVNGALLDASYKLYLRAGTVIAEGYEVNIAGKRYVVAGVRDNWGDVSHHLTAFVRELTEVAA